MIETPHGPFSRRHASLASGPIVARDRWLARSRAIALLVAVACGRNAPSRDAATSAAASGAPANAASPMPVSVEAVGRYGEDTYDMVKAGDWTRARVTVDSLAAAVATLAPAPGPDAPSATDVGTAVQAVSHAVTVRDRTTGMREANRLTELGARLAAGYHPPVPTDVTLLDYYGRELEIWSAANDLGKLRSTATAIRRIWTALRPQVEARGGAVEASTFDALVTRAEGATTSAAYAALATPILDAVDGLEKVFTR